MTTHTLDVGERRFVWWPFTGLPDGAIPEVRIVGAGDWAQLEEDSDFEPAQPVQGASWWRALLAHPACTDNPNGTVVVPIGTSQLRHRIVGNPEIEIPDPGEYAASRSPMPGE